MQFSFDSIKNSLNYTEIVRTIFSKWEIILSLYAFVFVALRVPTLIKLHSVDTLSTLMHSKND